LLAGGLQTGGVLLFVLTLLLDRTVELLLEGTTLAGSLFDLLGRERRIRSLGDLLEGFNGLIEAF
jgi:hypothetical protein